MLKSKNKIPSTKLYSSSKSLLALKLNAIQMELTDEHINALDEAERRIAHADFCPYLDLKILLPKCSKSRTHRKLFESMFSQYYDMGVGRLSCKFKEKFFDILFHGKVLDNGKPAFSRIFSSLNKFPQKNGVNKTQFVFVSKLVAIHDETSPIYDKHVRAFFGKTTWFLYKDKEKRIQNFTEFLNGIKSDYCRWVEIPRVCKIINRLKKRDSHLASCDNVRLLDFLVWKVGREDLL